MQKYDIFPWHAISCFWISPGFILFLYSVLPFLVFLPISMPVFSLFPSWRRGFRRWWCLSFAARRQRFLFPSDCFPPRNWPFLPLKAVTFALLCGQSVGNSAAENLPKHYRKGKNGAIRAILKPKMEKRLALWLPYITSACARQPFPIIIGRFYKLVFHVMQCFCLTWMSSRLSHRRFLSFIQSRSPLRSLVKNKNLRHDSRKYIAS